MPSIIVILGTGGTIAGVASDPTDNLGYVSAQRSVAELLASVPGLATLTAQPIECEQVAQLDSKDMDYATWQRLAMRAAHHLQRGEVAGVVVTHGTDTLEETAWFLHRVLAPVKPLVLTAAMRPATTSTADGPQNLFDAVTLAREPGARGVLAVLAGKVFAGAELRKIHSFRLDAFEGGEAGPLALIERGCVRALRPWPKGAALGLSVLLDDAGHWPRVEIVTSHAGASGAVVDALAAAGAQGIAVAGTGNGSVHHALEAALRRAQGRGVAVLRVSRCALGGVIGGVIGGVADGVADDLVGGVSGDNGSPLPSLPELSAPQARVELLLRLLVKRFQRGDSRQASAR